MLNLKWQGSKFFDFSMGIHCDVEGGWDQQVVCEGHFESYFSTLALFPTITDSRDYFTFAAVAI